MRRALIVILVAIADLVCAFAQAGAPAADEASAATELELQQRLLLATSSDAYPVTPGDVYRLTYRQADTPVTQDILVETDYSLNMKVFGKMNAAGMAFTQLKPVVEKAVAAAYPRSMPALVIYSLGIFQVYVKGELPQSANVIAWGLSRLSEIVESRRGPYSSLRNIKIQSRDGSQKSFDLFKAFRLGVAAEDPLVKPGDIITLARSERLVEVAGAVHLPGTYELLPGEQLHELIESYGGGTTSEADVARLRIERRSGDRVRVEYVSLAEGSQKGTRLENGDLVSVPVTAENLPVVAFEGAVLQQASGAAATPETTGGGTPAYNRITYTFKEGETLSDALRAVRGFISPLADLSSATVIRTEAVEPIIVDLRNLLASSTSPTDMPLQPNDRVVIPVLRFSVFVSGAVESPGTYPYAPGRTYHYYVTLAGGSTQDAPEKIFITDVNGKMRDQKEVIQSEDRIFLIPADVMVQGAVFSPGSFPFRDGLPVSYYLNLAGGIDPERNVNRQVHVYDSSGNRRKADEPVMPGDRIYVPNNAFVYNFNRYAPVVVTILGIVLTTLQIINAFPP